MRSVSASCIYSTAGHQWSTSYTSLLLLVTSLASTGSTSLDALVGRGGLPTGSGCLPEESYRLNTDTCDRCAHTVAGTAGQAELPILRGAPQATCPLHPVRPGA